MDESWRAVLTNRPHLESKLSLRGSTEKVPCREGCGGPQTSAPWVQAVASGPLS